jgi:hypothetical protein
MCDYSLHGVESRPARVGDRLVTSRFANMATRGFAEPGAPRVAVCLLPGTELTFDKEARRDHPLGRLLRKSRFGRLGGTVARFRQINTDIPSTHHDALEFSDGTIVLVTQLSPGQHATVLQLPVSPEGTLRHDETERVLVVHV